MRRWIGSGVRIFRQPHCRPFALLTNSPRVPTQQQIRRLTTTSGGERVPRELQHYQVFSRFDPPTQELRASAKAWASLLQAALPAHLRNDATNLSEPGTSTHTPAVTLDAQDVAEIVLSARKYKDVKGPLDPLYELAVGQNRWRAVVWLVKIIVEKYAVRILHRQEETEAVVANNVLQDFDDSLQSLTARSRGIKVNRRKIQRKASSAHNSPSASLRAATADIDSDVLDSHRLRHEVFGSVWRTLGMLTLHCANRGEMKQEVLEIIALLHHHEIMPTAIYSYDPPENSFALQQPPTLHLLSGRILTALSDAAWKAHEARIIEEAKLDVAGLSWFRPEIPSSSYRVRVSGVKPELWLEFVLWSCLHGGWVADGAAVLCAVCRNGVPDQSLTWKPISWRDRLQSMLPSTTYEHELPNMDLDQLKYIFDTRTASALDVDRDAGSGLERTISSEVAGAYADAIVDSAVPRGREEGQPVDVVLQQLHTLQQFFFTNNLDLGFTTWDALVFRLMVDDSHDLELGSTQAMQLANMVPLSSQLRSLDNVSELNTRVAANSALPIGLLYAAMRDQIERGDVDGLLKLFKTLQDRTDREKYHSIIDFFACTGLTKGDNIKNTKDFFTPTRVSSEPASKPSSHHQVPSTILAPMLNLLLDNKHYLLAKWLVKSKDVDGPVIPEVLYADPVLAPSLLRLAAEVTDKKLVQSILEAVRQNGRSMPKSVLSGILSTHIKYRRWANATTILDHMLEEQQSGLDGALTNKKSSVWDLCNLLELVRVMITLQPSVTAKEGVAVPEGAKRMFSAMVNGKYGQPGLQATENEKVLFERQVDSLLLVFASLNSSCDGLIKETDPKWMQSKRYIHFEMETSAFNSILEAVYDAHGVANARKLVGTFWPSHLRAAQAHSAIHDDPADLGKTKETKQNSSYLKRRSRPPSILEREDRIRTEVLLQGTQRRVPIYGGIRPNIGTFKVVMARTLNAIAQEQSNATEHDASHESKVDKQTSPPAQDHLDSFLSYVQLRVSEQHLNTLSWLLHGFADIGLSKEQTLQQFEDGIAEHNLHGLGDILRTLQAKKRRS